jgi:high affinity Mn2+ porin
VTVRKALLAIFVLIVSGSARAQQAVESSECAQTGSTAPVSASNTPGMEVKPERWNLSFQATSIGQYHGTFHAPYTGPNSLENNPEYDVSLTTTMFLGLRLTQNTQLYFNPEIAGGKGFSGVDGIANFPNGEMPRVAGATPKPYIARLYITHDFGFGPAKESFTSDDNQLAGQRPMTRYTIVVGRFTVTDYFDNNRYTHDPRTQFMGWAVMYNGAWDYPADTRGYTWGWVNEFHARRWSLRYASTAEPKVANGMQLDRRLFQDRSDMFEGEVRYEPNGHPGAVRFLSFFNHTDSGTYADALRIAHENGGVPDVTATRRVGTLKYGFGINLEQEISKDVGAFLRLGWNDGKTESFAFAAIDRLASGGVAVTGTKWKRPFDTAATALTFSGVSGVHAAYLAAGGLDFMIGDGALRYGPESIWESYYSARVFPGVFTTFDLQRLVNPAYNRDRGPLWIPTIRLHVELGPDLFRRQGKH